MYGFHRIRNENSEAEFQNNLFRKGNKYIKYIFKKQKDN